MVNDPASFTTKHFNSIEALIVAGQTSSAAVNVSGLTGVGLKVPAGMTNTSLTFSTSLDGGQTWDVIKDVNSQAIAQTIDSEGGAYPLVPAVFFPWNTIRINIANPEASDFTLEVMPGNI